MWLISLSIFGGDSLLDFHVGSVLCHFFLQQPKFEYLSSAQPCWKCCEGSYFCLQRGASRVHGSRQWHNWCLACEVFQEPVSVQEAVLGPHFWEMVAGIGRAGASSDLTWYYGSVQRPLVRVKFWAVFFDLALIYPWLRGPAAFFSTSEESGGHFVCMFEVKKKNKTKRNVLRCIL